MLPPLAKLILRRFLRHQLPYKLSEAIRVAGWQRYNRVRSLCLIAQHLNRRLVIYRGRICVDWDQPIHVVQL